MKNFFIGIAMLTAASSILSSCGGGENTPVNSDTIISAQLSDSISMAMGAFTGANIRAQNPNITSPDDFIKTYQLIVAGKYTKNQLLALSAALYMAQQIYGMESDGIPINRDILLQEFRKYFQNTDFDSHQMALLYERAQQLSGQV